MAIFYPDSKQNLHKGREPGTGGFGNWSRAVCRCASLRQGGDQPRRRAMQVW